MGTFDSFQLKGRVVALTGSAGFFGGYFARALLEAGAAVVILIDKKENDLNEQAQQLRQEFGEDRIRHYQIDLYDREKAGHLFQTLADDRGGVDILVNCAFDFSPRTGFNVAQGWLKDSSLEQFMLCLESGVGWSFLTTQILGLGMKKKGGGSIINICSMYGIRVPMKGLYDETDKINPPGYPPAKAALLHFTSWSAKELAPEVRVNAISPGIFSNFELAGANAYDPNNPVLQRLMGSGKVLLGRFGHPRDLIGALLFLASDASSYVTGANIVIDGGFTIT